MRVLVTGANGFLGYYVCELLLRHDHEVIATGRGECRLPFKAHASFHYVPMDFTDPFRVHDVFQHYQPEVVIHAGAKARPDDCEVHQWEAYMTNVEGTLNLLSNSAEAACHFIFLSTDFVFDGRKGMYMETDSPSPVNFYGKTKKEAEDAVREYGHDWSIIRTILVYGEPRSGGYNVLSVLKSKLEKGESYQMVTDQFRTPTYVGDLARGIVAVMEKKAKGTWHISGEDMTTPYEMGKRTAKLLGLDPALVVPVTSSAFAQPALRPPRTGFIIEKAKKELGFEPVSFEEGLRLTFNSSSAHSHSAEGY
jgi:dTDP-4-dehydrorhamnose reductase